MNIGDCYDNICEQWHDFRKNCTLNSCIAEFIGLLEDGCAVLDVGCGTGYPVSASLAERGFYVTGIDLSEKMIGKAKKLRLPHAQFFYMIFYPTVPAANSARSSPSILFGTSRTAASGRFIPPPQVCSRTEVIFCSRTEKRTAK